MTYMYESLMIWITIRIYLRLYYKYMNKNTKLEYMYVKNETGR